MRACGALLTGHRCCAQTCFGAAGAPPESRGSSEGRRASGGTGTWLWESYFQASSRGHAPSLPELPEASGPLPFFSFPAKKPRHSPSWKGWLWSPPDPHFRGPHLWQLCRGWAAGVGPGRAGRGVAWVPRASFLRVGNSVRLAVVSLSPSSGCGLHAHPLTDVRTERAAPILCPNTPHPVTGKRSPAP